MHADGSCADAEAAAFMAYWLRKRLKVQRILFMLAVLVPVLQVAGGLTYFSVVHGFSPDKLFGRMLCSLMFPPLFVALVPGFFIARRYAHKALLDAGGQLVVTEGKLDKSWVLTEGDWHPRSLVAVSVQHVFVQIPYVICRRMPQAGIVRVAYFPNTRICWTVNGTCIWKVKVHKSGDVVFVPAA